MSASLIPTLFCLEIWNKVGRPRGDFMNTHCDVFRSRTQTIPTYLYANVGELRSRLDMRDWDHVGMGVTPLFANKSIAKRGYHIEKITPKARQRVLRFYGR